MLYKFKSKSTGDLIMLQPNGQRMLEIIGKDHTAATAAQGIILHEQMPDAIAALEAAIVQEEADRKAAAALAQEHDETPPIPQTVSLRQRATPFIDMLRLCEKDGAEIVWGV
jgi:hypothetical protein